MLKERRDRERIINEAARRRLTLLRGKQVSVLLWDVAPKDYCFEIFFSKSLLLWDFRFILCVLFWRNNNITFTLLVMRATEIPTNYSKCLRSHSPPLFQFRISARIDIWEYFVCYSLLIVHFMGGADALQKCITSRIKKKRSIFSFFFIPERMNIFSTACFGNGCPFF